MTVPDGNVRFAALAVDDERGPLSMLVEVLEKEPRIGTIRTASDATEALSHLRGDQSADGAEPIDVVFLDIRMPGLDGLELARVLTMLPDPPAIVFVTAYERDRAIEAFDIGATDYLMKPVTSDRLANTMRRIAKARRDATGPAEDESGGDDEVIPVELAGTTKLVPRSSVRWVEAQGDYARLHTVDGSHLVRIPLSQLEDRWSEAGFVRIHRSFLVSLSLVTELRMSSSGYVVRVGNGDDAAELPVSRRHTRDLKDRLVRAAKQGWGPR